MLWNVIQTVNAGRAPVVSVPLMVAHA